MARIFEFHSGERIISAGDKDKRMYIIMEGSVQIRLREGQDAVVVAVLKKNDFFGEMSLFSNRPRTADVIAVGEVRVAYIESLMQLKSFLATNTLFAVKMVQVLAERLARTDEILLDRVSEINKLKIDYHQKDGSGSL